MKFMLLIYAAEAAWTAAERLACKSESQGIFDELAVQGKFLGAAPLEPVRTAASVRVRQGQALVTDGPFAETKEQLGGFILLDVANLDEAIAVAGRLPPAARGTVEARAVVALDGLPEERPPPTTTGDARSPFLLLCYHEEGVWDAAGPETLAQALAEAKALARRLQDEGRYLSAAPLHPAATARSVRVRDGQRLVTGGPFAETHEVLGGYYLILAEDRATAVRFASQHPGARLGTVEVRPVCDLFEPGAPS
jgi:hypothetical protein